MTDAAHQHESFSIERVYPHNRAYVWSAWADPNKKARWFGEPEGEADFRVGGSEIRTFSDAMGTHTNATRYFEIADEQRIVMAYSMALDGRVHTVSLATVVFADEGEGTRLTFTEQMCIIPPSDGVEGRENGWGGILQALGETLARETASSG